MTDNPETPAFVKVDDNTVKLMCFINLTAYGVVLFLALLIAPFVIWRLGGWWPALCAVALPISFLIRLYQATFTTIAFPPGAVKVRGALLPASTVGPFVCKHFADTQGIDEAPGHIEIWLSDHAYDATYVASMSGSADGAAIVRLLNAKLEHARRR